MKEFYDIDLIEKFICLMIVATIFIFCFWQELDEKRKTIDNTSLTKKPL